LDVRGQTAAKTEPLFCVPLDEVALNGTAGPFSHIRRVAVPDGGVEQDHRSGFPTCKNLAGVFRPKVTKSIAWNIGPLVRSRDEASRPILFPEGIQGKNEAKQRSIFRRSGQIRVKFLCGCSRSESSRQKGAQLEGFSYEAAACFEQRRVQKDRIEYRVESEQVGHSGRTASDIEVGSARFGHRFVICLGQVVELIAGERTRNAHKPVRLKYGDGSARKCICRVDLLKLSIHQMSVAKQVVSRVSLLNAASIRSSPARCRRTQGDLRGRIRLTSRLIAVLDISPRPFAPISP
jgi:hypothetical protein